MQQISPPLRIALAAILVLAAVWFVALRPKGADDEPAAVTAPGVEGLTNSVAKARGAKEAADASVARTEQAVGGVDESASGSGSATQSGSKTSASSGKSGSAATAGSKIPGPAGKLVTALDRGKVVVLLFRNKSADSAHVARVVRGVYKREGIVVTEIASVKDVADYSVFTNRTSVSQAPTTFIIGPTRRAKVIAGYTSTGEVDQAIGDVLGKRSGVDKYGSGRGRDDG